jgi:putative hemolysin
MRFGRALLFAVLLALAACAGPQRECPSRSPDQEPDGGIGGTGYVNCPGGSQTPVRTR